MSQGAWDVAIVIAAAIVAAAITAAVARARGRRLRDDVDRATASMAERARATARADEVRRLIDSTMQDGLLLFDRDGQLAHANDASDRLLARRPGSIAQLFPAAAAEMAGRTATSREAEIVEVETASPGRWLRFTASPAGGGGVLVIVADITESRRLESIRRDFVTNASHELKTPAASIQAAAETVLRAIRDDPASVPRFAATLEQEAARLSRIVADLLDLSRLEAGGAPAGVVRLDALASEEAKRYEERAREAGLALAVATEPVPAVRGSERDLALLIGNLVDNAIRYTPAGGTVDVSVDTETDRIRLRVADSGIGIPRRDLDRVLERFYRVDRGRSRRTGGTGLGLSIVRHVAENHGGSVRMRSELGRGTTVDVLLPVQGRRAAGDRPATSAQTDPATSPSA